MIFLQIWQIWHIWHWESFDTRMRYRKMTFLENFFWCALKLSDRAPKPLVRSYWSMRFFWNVSQLDSVLTGLPRGHQKCLLIDGTPCISILIQHVKYLTWKFTRDNWQFMNFILAWKSINASASSSSQSVVSHLSWSYHEGLGALGTFSPLDRHSNL